MVVTGGDFFGLFCPDMGILTISGLDADIVVDFSLSIAGKVQNSWSERYTPDASGKVAIRELGNIMMDYFQPVGIEVDYSLNEQEPINCRGIIEGKINDTPVISQPLFYCTQKVGITNMYYDRFFNRYAKRMVRANQYVPVVHNYNSQVMEVGVAYRVGGEVCYGVLSLGSFADQPHNFKVHNLSPVVIATRINNQKQVSITADDLIYYEATLSVDNNVVDKIRFDMDHKHYKQLTHFVFYNLFGFPETIYMTGKDEKSAEMEGTYALISEQYTKIDTELNELHTVNSGYISETSYESIKDMIRSREVYRYNGTYMERITITDVDLVAEKPRSTPLNVKITYRLAKDDDAKFIRPGMADGKVFDETFDNTFA